MSLNILINIESLTHTNKKVIYEVFNMGIYSLNIACSLLRKFGSFGNALNSAYPEFDWQFSKFSTKGKKSTQRWLMVKLRHLLPTATILEEYFHPELSWGI